MHYQIAALIKDTNKNEEMAIELVQQSVLRTFSSFSYASQFLKSDSNPHLFLRRTSRPTTRSDFLTRILRQREVESDDNSGIDVTDLQIAAHVSDFVLAGSETTSTVLSTATYYMLKDENVYETLAQEIRSAFDSPEKINDYSCRNLAYLNAVCKEAMRIYAPLPIATPREVPEGGDTVDGHFIPSGVRILPFLPFPVSSSFGSPTKTNSA